MTVKQKTLDCNYLKEDEYEILTNLNNEAGKLTYFMITNPEKLM